MRTSESTRTIEKTQAVKPGFFSVRYWNNETVPHNKSLPQVLTREYRKL